jgi:hypothetical protein
MSFCGSSKSLAVPANMLNMINIPKIMFISLGRKHNKTLSGIAPNHACDRDAKIAALEGKLSKARHVKQGMMSMLLTGKVRLL